MKANWFILIFGFVLSVGAQENSSLNRTVSPSIEFEPTENEITVRFSVFNKEQFDKSIDNKKRIGTDQ